MARRVKHFVVTAEERDSVLRAFEDGLRQVPRDQLDVERMRWHCRITDPHGHATIVAEYRLRADGTYELLWVLPDVFWPVPPRKVSGG